MRTNLAAAVVLEDVEGELRHSVLVVGGLSIEVDFGRWVDLSLGGDICDVLLDRWKSIRHAVLGYTLRCSLGLRHVLLLGRIDDDVREHLQLIILEFRDTPVKIPG